ncbi:MAG: MFS transporter [bacterium]|nr:MFS transporter [bacterium]
MQRLFWIVTASLPAAVVCAVTWFGSFVFVNGFVIKGLGWSNEDWTRVVICMTLGMFVWYALITEVSARVGRRRAVALTMALSVIGYLAMSQATTFWTVGGALILLSSMPPAYMVAWTPFVAEAGGDRPGRAMATSALTLNLVASAALIAGGYLIDPAHYREAFLVLAVICACALVAFLKLSDRLETDVRAGQVASGMEPRPRPTSVLRLGFDGIRELAQGPFFVVIVFGTFAAPFSFQASNALFPNLARDVHGFSEETIATLVGLSRFMTLGTLFLVSRNIDRWNPVRCYAVGLLLDAVAIGAIAWAPGPTTAGIAYLSFYVVHGIVWGSAAAALSVFIHPRLKDSAFAIAMMSENASLFGASALQHVLVRVGGSLPLVFTVSACVTAALSTTLLARSFSRSVLSNLARAREPRVACAGD